MQPNIARKTIVTIIFLWAVNGVFAGEQYRDVDNDGLEDSEEIASWSTDPSKVDTDGDGLTDGQEVALRSLGASLVSAGFPNLSYASISPAGRHSLGGPQSDYAFLAAKFPSAGAFSALLVTQGLGADADSDGLPDWVESQFSGDVHPFTTATEDGDLDDNGIDNLIQFEMGMALDAEAGGKMDSDSDRMSNVFELANGLNPAASVDAVGDEDSDGLFNFEEYANGSSPRRIASFGNARTVLVRWHAPPDEESRIAVYLEEVLPVSDFANYHGGQCLWKPVAERSLSDTPLEASPVVWTREDVEALPPKERPSYKAFAVPARLATADWDSDGLSDSVEFQLLLHAQPSLTTIEISQALRNPDTDGDGVSDADEDADQDGLTNLAEVSRGTLLWSADSDGDGVDDLSDAHPRDATKTARVLTITSPADGRAVR